MVDLVSLRENASIGGRSGNQNYRLYTLGGILNYDFRFGMQSAQSLEIAVFVGGIYANSALGALSVSLSCLAARLLSSFFGQR